MHSFKKLYSLLTAAERFRASCLIFLTVIMALLDTLGVASIMPFMMVVSNPSLIETHPLLAKVYLFFNFSKQEPFIFFLGGATLATLIISMCFKIFVTYLQANFILLMEHSLGQRLIRQYLNQSYCWFLNRNSSELGKTLLSEIGGIVGNVMTPLMNLITQIFAALALLCLIFFANPRLAMIVFITLGLSYLFVHLLTNRRIKYIGEKRFLDNSKRYSVVMEVFSAIKEIKISGLESIYIERFSRPSKSYAKNQATFQVIANIPRFAIEAIAIGGMLFVMLYLLSGDEGFDAALPILALYGMAGYRLMPALQQIYASIVALTYSKPAIESLHSDFIETKLDANLNSSAQELGTFKQNIALNKITFIYPGASQPALRDINIDFPVNKTIGIVGSTGSGKTTILDITLGLLDHTQGSVEVDGIKLNELNIPKWRKQIGYVPQNILLIDDTVAANIAFGIGHEFVDKNSLERAARIANLHDFILEKLPMGYETMVGERGVRLSGGERQRIAIARALYHKPQLLVFDEATSALDNATEKIVMEAVNNLEHKLTIIIVAHKLNTVKKCDIIYHISDGNLVSSGTYDELRRADPVFRSMTN
jgi:ABC-type multidrug transport system fused ATPase/permease subunit